MGNWLRVLAGALILQLTMLPDVAGWSNYQKLNIPTRYTVYGRLLHAPHPSGRKSQWSVTSVREICRVYGTST